MPEDDLEILLLKRKQLELKRKRLDAIKSFGLRFYVPRPKQDLFHRATNRLRRVRAGNRFGKSEMGAAEDCAWSLNERPWYPTGDPARTSGIPQHPTKLLIVTTDWGKVDEIFTNHTDGKLWRMFPRDGFVKRTVKNGLGVTALIECANGSVVRFYTKKSWQTEPQGAESTDWDAIHIDEPIPEDMYKAIARGLVDRGGSAWFTLTPLSERWIDDFFEQPGTWSIDGTIYDNDTLSPEGIRMFDATLTEEEKSCRLYGVPLFLSGMVYKGYDRRKHVIPPREIPICWPVYYAIDPHPQTPHAVLFLAVSPTGQHIYFDEIFQHCSIAELAARIKEKLEGRFVVRGICDPLGFIEHPITETSMATELSRCGIFVLKSSKAREQGILRVQAALKTPEFLYITENCRRTTWEFPRYSWNEETNKPVDKDDHMMENIYRLELEEPRFVTQDVNSNPIEDIEITSPNWKADTELTFDYADNFASLH